MNNTLLIVVGSLDVGGTERQLVQILPRLDRDKYNIVIYTSNHKGILAAQLERENIIVIEPPFNSFLRRLGKIGKYLLYFVSLIRLSMLMLFLKPAIAHFYLVGPYILGTVCGLLTRCRCMLMSRRIVYNEAYKKSWLHKIECRLHPYMNSILANSKEIAADLVQEGAQAEKVEIIYNGVDLQRFAEMPEREQARTSLHIEPSTLVMSIVANLHARKAHGDLLLALAKAKGQLPLDWQLLCVGRDEGMLRPLQKRSHQLGLGAHVQWLGQRFDIPKILAATDFSILCSYEEGLSNSLLESMAASLPIIVTDVSGSNEVVIEATTGFIVPVGSVEELSEAIVKMAKSSVRRSSMGLQARQQAERHYSLDIVVYEYEKLYDAFLAQSDDAYALDA